MSNLYNLTNEVIELQNALMETVDYETGEVDTLICNALDCKREEFNKKAVNVAKLVRLFYSQIEDCNAELKRVKAIKDRIEKATEKLEKYLTSSCLAIGVDKIENVNANISFRTSTKTIINDIDAIPDEYKKAKITYTPDLILIKKAIENGVEVKGAELQVNKNIQIK